MPPHVQTSPAEGATKAVGGCYGLLRGLVDRQERTLEALYPGLMGVVDMRPVEHWCVWGALLEIREDDPEQVRSDFADYVRRREGLSTSEAWSIARAVQAATSKSHSLADGVALAGREAVRSGFDRCFLVAAMYLRQPVRREG